MKQLQPEIKGEKYAFVLTDTMNQSYVANLMHYTFYHYMVVDDFIIPTNQSMTLDMLREQIEESLIINPIDAVFICINPRQQELLTIQILINYFEQFGIDVNLIPDSQKPYQKYSPSQTVHSHGQQCQIEISTNPSQYMLNITDPISTAAQRVIVRGLDLFLGLFGGFFCLLFGIFIAIAIKLEDQGPVIYSQQRVGHNGRQFTFYKFRSMVMQSSYKQEEFRLQNKMEGPIFKLDNDPRVTRVGRFLRRTSLDELPQFINVILGDMSLVGTRPPTVNEVAHYQPHHKRRLRFKVGMTGNWQVNGRNNITNFEEVVRLDTEYMENWSVTRDLIILIKTIGVVIRGTGAK